MLQKLIGAITSLNLKKKLKSSFRFNHLLFNFSIRSFAKLLSKLMGLITLPIIARALCPESYGNYNIVNIVLVYTSLPMALLGLRSYGIREIAAKRKDTSYANDISIEQLRESTRANVYDYYIRGDVSQINNLIKTKSFDAVVAMDLIEHLNKEEGLTLIKNLSNIVRKKIIIYTPNGFLFQPPSVNNPYQEHKSGWTYKEMEQLGFDVIGVNGYKRLTGLYAVPIVKPNALGVFIRNISVIILKIIRREDLSYAILCVKSI